MSDPIVGKFLSATVHVSDHERARKFYSETLGFKLIDKNEQLKFTMFEAGGLSFGSHVPWGGGTGRGIGGGTGVIFQTGGNAKAFEERKARGGRIGGGAPQRGAVGGITGCLSGTGG